VITDFRMPGMNGAELLEKIRHTVPSVQGLIVTGDPDATEIDEKRYPVLDKGDPGLLKLFLERIREALEAEK
jgi:CheY-like chemotaxis protein